MKFDRAVLGVSLSFLIISSAVAFECEGVATVEGEAIQLELVTTGISRPVDVATPPGDTDRIFVVDQNGLIRVVDITSDRLLPAPFLDIRSRVRCCGERGLLGLAFHPDYATNGYFYVNYTRPMRGVCSSSPPPGCPSNRDSETVVSRFQVSDADPNRADPASEQILLEFCQPYGNHNGGQLQFGPNDGYLYISTGDGGSGGDPCSSGQHMGSFLGKILRIDVDGGDPYAIPATNPYRDTAGRPEIWALGLRNPWRFSFDPVTGDMYIADVGQGAWEEIDFQPGDSAGGENYEWRIREGDHTFSAGTRPGPGVQVAPIYEYNHSSAFLGRTPGRSVTGGVVYRGCSMPDLHGRYFFADYTNHWIKSFRVDEQGNFTDLVDHTAELNAGIAGRFTSVSAFGVDGRGEMYVCALENNLYRVISSGPPNNRPTARIVTDPSPPDVTLVDGSAEVTLDGSTSDDGGDGPGPLSYRWARISGPSSGVSIATPDEAITTVTFTQPSTYRFRLTVNDTRDSDTETVRAEVTEPPLPQFIRGDSNGDGIVDLSDGVRILVALFLQLDLRLDCADAGDSNNTGDVDVSDAVYIFNFLFVGGAPIPEPITCGPDPDEDGIDCESYTACEGT